MQGILAEGLQIQEGAFQGIPIFLDDDLDPGKLGLVGQHVDESRKRDGKEVLVVDGANVHRLFPTDIVSDSQGAEPFAHHPVHNVPAGPMQIMVDFAIALVGQTGKAV